jgi:hypothetical protein
MTLPPERSSDEEDSDGIDDLVRDLAAPFVPPRFAARVMQEHGRRQTRARRAVAVSAIAAAAVCVVVIVVRAPVSAEVVAAGRETVHMGSHVIAVLEPNARINYDMTSRAVFAERIDVRQPAGRAFYRVDKGTPVVVHTPAGDVVVHGTCFTVDLTAPPHIVKENPMSALAAGPNVPSALVGAVAGVLLTVVVYEGAMHVENKLGDVAIGPGQVAVARADSAPTVTPAAADTPMMHKLRADNEQLLASLDNARAAAGGDVQRLLAENQALRESLKRTDDQLARAEIDRKDKERPFPKDLAPRFEQPQLLSSVTAALKEAGVEGDVTHVDCDEFPCIVYGDVKLGKNGDAGALANKLKESSALAQYREDEDHNSWWRSLKKDPKTGQEIDETHFGVALWPKVSDDDSDEVGKRIGFRNQQMWDAMKPARR